MPKTRDQSLAPEKGAEAWESAFSELTAVVLQVRSLLNLIEELQKALASPELSQEERDAFTNQLSIASTKLAMVYTDPNWGGVFDDGLTRSSLKPALSSAMAHEAVEAPQQALPVEAQAPSAPIPAAEEAKAETKPASFDYQELVLTADPLAAGEQPRAPEMPLFVHESEYEEGSCYFAPALLLGWEGSIGNSDQ